MKGDRRIDVGVVTALPINADELLQILASSDGFIDISLEGRYYKVVLNTYRDVEMTIVIACESDNSNGTISAIASSKMISLWNPKVLVHVGLAKAFSRSGLRSGDVIVPTRVKKCFYRDCNDIIVMSEFGSYECSQFTGEILDVLQKNGSVIQYYGYSSGIAGESFLQGSHGPIVDAASDTALRVSSDCLLSDGSYNSALPMQSDYKNHGDFYNAIDCQAGDIIEACLFEETPLPWIIIKGISASGQDSAQSLYGKVASYNCCSVLRFLLLGCFPTDFFGNEECKNENVNSLIDEIADKITDLYDEEKWEEACILAKALSRTLWLSAEYDMRINFGRLVDSCKDKFENADSYRMGALIDDIGWTLYYSENDIDDAKQFICDGIAIAERINDYYYMAKGYRHLASIEQNSGNITAAESWLNNADENAERIKRIESKREMKASLMLSRAKLYGAMERDDDRKKAISIAETVAKEYLELDCADRAVKTYRFIGEMYEALGDYERAMEYYSLGRKESQRLERVDEMEQNKKRINSQLSRYLET